MEPHAPDHDMLLRTLRAACEGLRVCDRELDALGAAAAVVKNGEGRRKRLQQRRETWTSVIAKLTAELDAIDPSESEVQPCERKAVKNAE